MDVSKPAAVAASSAINKTSASQSAQDLSKEEGFKAERERIHARRLDRQLACEQCVDDLPNWGFACSGGGIRSATFCLGVMQALSKEDIATGSDVPARQGAARSTCLLERFDYLSTVSGGSYIGAFFGSLFVPGRLTCNKEETPTAAADRAYATLAVDPPGRIYPKEPRDEKGTKAIAWLRENGRYLTPTGAGDLSYAIALLIRNWLAIAYVICSALLLCLSVLALLRHGIALSGQDFAFEQTLLASATTVDPQSAGAIHIWWSALVILPLVPLMLAIPQCIAYWLVYSTRDASDDYAKLRGDTLVYCCGVLIISIIGIVFTWRSIAVTRLPWLFGLGFIWLAGALAIAFYRQFRKEKVAMYRVRVTWSLNTTLLWMISLACFALADTIAQCVYLYATQHSTNHYVLAIPSGIAGVLVTAILQGAKLFDGKKQSSIVSKLPLSMLAIIPAALLALMVFISTDFIVLWLRWNGGTPVAEAIGTSAWVDPRYTTCVVLAWLFVIAAVLTLISGRFSGFLNLSTLQSLYAARLARAYLGATNGARFPAPSNNAADAASRQDRNKASVAEPVEHDDLILNDYFDPSSRAPVHLINVTMNLTLDPSDQLVQRDRKGQPLCIAPGRVDEQNRLERTNLPPDYYARFLVDGEPVRQAHADKPRNEIEQPRRLSEWVAISGAAISTGLGRTTSLGTSILLGLANVRLGSWWAASRIPDRRPELPFTQRILSTFAKTQVHLGYELLARFYGMRREWQYLSDGGHFENMGVYELLRPERKMKVIVACDCGADPNFAFDDLANLVRLARIDFKVEIEVDVPPAENISLRGIFGTPADFRNPEAPAGLCAILFNVFRPAESAQPNRTLIAKIVLLKPRMIDTNHADLLQYKIQSPTFPHETTADQFFNQAQWESYRKLGLSIATRVFGRASDGGHGLEVAKILDSPATVSRVGR